MEDSGFWSPQMLKDQSRIANCQSPIASRQPAEIPRSARPSDPSTLQCKRAVQLLVPQCYSAEVLQCCNVKATGTRADCMDVTLVGTRCPCPVARGPWAVAHAVRGTLSLDSRFPDTVGCDCGCHKS